MARIKKTKKNKNNYKTSVFVVVAFLNFLILFFVVTGSTEKRNTVITPIVYGNSIEENVDELVSDEYILKDPYITRSSSLGAKIINPSIKGDDPSLGARDASVNLILFSDINCDFCKDQYKTIKNVLAKYPDDVRLIWKDYPELNIESDSWKASMGGRCAYEQGEFWNYYEAMSEAVNTDPKVVAREAGLDVKDFSKCLEKEEVADRLEQSVYEADSLEIFGVPYMFVNNRELLGEISEDELVKIINFELQGGQ